MRENFRRLAHVEVDDRIGEAALEADHRLEERRPEARDRLEPRPGIARREHRPVPVDRAPAEHQRRMAQRLGAAGQDQVGLALADVLVADVDRLHAGAAVDLHREGRHRLAHAETQRRDPRRIHLVGQHVDAAEDDLVERVGRERLAQQQRPAAGDGEIDRRERSWRGARLDERRAGCRRRYKPGGRSFGCARLRHRESRSVGSWESMGRLPGSSVGAPVRRARNRRPRSRPRRLWRVLRVGSPRRR